MDLFSYLLGKKAGGSKGTTVIANPELSGTEADLTGLQVGNTKYKVPDNLEHYSTDEQVVGTWIDGKPIYRKVIDFGYLPNNTSRYVSHGISNLKNIISAKGQANRPESSGVTFASIPIPNAGNNYVQLDVSDTIGITTNSNRIAFYGYVFLEYTKTTD